MQGVDYLASHAPSPFQHYWSLGVEEQFYLIWPAVILGTVWLIRRLRRCSRTEATSSQRPYLMVLAVVAAASFGLSVVMTYWIPPVAFFSLPTRAWQLAVGGLVALAAGHWRQLSGLASATIGWTGLGLITLACIGFGPATMYPGTAAVVPTLGAVLVIGAGCANPSQGCGRVLGLSPMRAIGRVSYSWYLWQGPILLLALWSIAPVTGHAPLLGLAGGLLSLGLAALTLRFIENPLRYAAPIRQSAWRSLSVGGVATALVVAVGFALYAPAPVGPGAPAATLTVTASPLPADSSMASYDAAVRQTFTQVQAAVAAAVDLKAVPSNLNPQLADTPKNDGVNKGCFRSFFEVGQPECATGDTSSTTTVALVGDSNAAAWSPAFQQVAERQRWRLETMTKAGCPPMDLPITNPILGREYTECKQWQEQIYARLKADKPQLIVLSMMRRYGARYGFASGFTTYESEWLDSLTRLVQQLRDTGAKVLVLGPIPDPGPTVHTCLWLHLADASACTPDKLTAVNQTGTDAESVATAAGGGQYVDLTELFCATDRCPVIVGNTLIYLDQNHATREYLEVLAPVIGVLASRAIAAR